MTIKRLILSLSLCMCFCLAKSTYAQRCLPGMQGIRITGGTVDGTKMSGNDYGYYFGLSMDTYTKSSNRFVFGAEFLNKYFAYKNEKIPMTQFTAEGGYYFNFLSDRNKIIMLSVGASALAGYQTSNWGESLLFDGSTLKNEDAFLYGGAVTFEIETYIYDRLVLFLSARERMLWGTSTGHFHAQLGLGVKFIID